MATLEQIARELNISKSTASKALTGARDVGKKTRQAVLEKAVELGYIRGRRAKTVGRLAVFIINMEYVKPEDFGYEIILGFRKAAEPAGCIVDLIPLDLQMQKDQRYDEYMLTHGYCGAFFLGLDLLCPWLREFETSVTPAVLYDNYVGGNPSVTQLGVDNDEAMELAVRHLYSLGHRKIGYLSGTLYSYVYRQRYAAFARAMEKMGLPVEESCMGAADHTSECLTVHLPRLLEQGCTAIACSHDTLAHSAMVYCTERGLRIPEDLSVLGYDDIPLCRYTVPPLTTIRQDRGALGKSAYYALSSQLDDVHLCTHLLHPSLVERASCAAPRQQD